MRERVPYGKNAYPNSFCLEKLRYAGRGTNTSIIIILNGTTRVRAIFSSSLRQTYSRSARPFAVATGSEAYSSFTPEPLDSLTTREANSADSRSSGARIGASARAASELDETGCRCEVRRSENFQPTLLPAVGLAEVRVPIH